MTFPEGVQLTTVVGQYLDAVGRPVKGTVTFRPDMSTIGEGVSVAPIAVRRPLDSEGRFSARVPVGVPGFTYEVVLAFEGGVFRRRVVQIPYSTDEVCIDDLIDAAPSTVAKFQFPQYSAHPENPQPGQVYYNTVDGISRVYDAIHESWDQFGTGDDFVTSDVYTAEITELHATDSMIANAVGEVTEAVAGKAEVVHAHAVSDVANLQATLDAKQPAGQYATATHVHAATDMALASKAPLDSPTFTGVVSGISKAMVGLSNVENTSDSAKPVSAAQQAALDAKAPLASPTFTGTVGGITKFMVGLPNVDNTSDSAKPVSIAQQAALDTKAPLASPTFTGTVSGITKGMLGLGNVDNTSDMDKPVSVAQAAANALSVAKTGDTMTGVLNLPAAGLTIDDVNLYRTVANQLKTDDAVAVVFTGTGPSVKAINTGGDGFEARVAATSNYVLLGRVSTDANYRFLIDATGKHTWGDGTAAGDTVLYRGSADVLRTDDSFWVVRNVANTYVLRASNVNAAGIAAWFEVAGASNAGINVGVTGDSQLGRLVIYGDGKITWGTGAGAADTNLYRSAADTLKTDDSLIVSGSLTGALTFRGAWSAQSTYVKGEVVLYRGSTYQANQAVGVAPTELATDGGFEAGVSNWVISRGTGTITQDATVFRSGTKSLKATATVANWLGVKNNTGFTTVVGRSYHVEAYVRHSATLSWYIVCDGSTGTSVSVPANTWTKLSLDYVAVSTSAVIDIRTDSAVVNGSAVNVDDVSLSEIGNVFTESQWNILATAAQPAYTTSARPTATSVPAGWSYYDTTLSKPAWSTGSVYKDAAGTTV